MTAKKDENVRYYAVADPRDPARMTYWREVNGRRKPWPAKACWAPQPTRADIPTGLGYQECVDRWTAWGDSVLTPWYAAVDDAIDAEPQLALARFATLHLACCICKRALTDPASVTYGIGPDCRASFPDHWLRQMAEAVARAHGEHLAAAATA